MKYLLIILLIISIIINIFQALKIYNLKKSIKQICISFEDNLKDDTNTLIDTLSRDKYITTLVSTINTELKNLKKLKQQFINGDKELKNSITNISHDLRTPLTAISGYLSLLEKEKDSEIISNYISKIKNKVEVLTKLIEEFFNYSIVTTTNNLIIEEINLNNVLENTIASFYDELTINNISPTIKICTTPVIKKLDKVALTRIFSNIISNAIKYSDGNLNIELNEDGKITFSNTSSKLSNVDANKLFDRFYTVDTASKSTGLGLSIAKILVEKLNGKISANYKNNTIFIVINF
ncbi:MAG: HAMP domain-containing histidine kinase [Clostridia bacterium]|nr:HAMP domain-containing histidine kinase [Clostridia bacterium]